MKKHQYVVLAFIGLCVLLIGLLQTARTLRRSEVRSVEPLTLERLEALRSSPRRTGDTTTNEHGGGAQSHDGPLAPGPPGRLKRKPTRQEVNHAFPFGRGGEKVPASIMCAALEGMETLLWATGAESAAFYSWQLGREAYMVGDTETARNYFRTALSGTLTPYEMCHTCAHLAWLEDDPAVAERLLELSCQTDEPTWLSQAAKLGHVTGSASLRDHYLTRLHAVDGEWADAIEKDMGLARTQSQ